MSNQPKKQIIKGSHWLPRTYLKHFLVDNKLFMYKKGERFFKKEFKFNQRIIEISGENGLNNIAKENNFYRIEAKNVDPNFIENFFGEIVENDLDRIIQEVQKKNIGDGIDKKLKNKLSLFMATMKIRTPQFKSEIEEIVDNFFKMKIKGEIEFSLTKPLSKKEKEKAIKCYFKDTGKVITGAELDRKIEEARKQMINGDFGDIKVINSSNNFFLKTSLAYIERFAIVFSNMRMSILKAKEGRYFITSDNPVVYFVPSDKTNFYNPPKSLASPDTEVFFPLTKDYAVYLNRHKDFQEIVMFGERKMVEIFKENIAYNSKDFIFSPLKINFLNKFIEEYIPYPFKLVSS